MYSTTFLFRLVKSIAVAMIGLMALLIVIGNITDYYTNYHFVEHVMMMDTTFPESNIHYRSIHNELIFHFGYVMIILLEAFMAFCCIKGSWSLFKHLRSPAPVYHAAKNWSVAGLLTGVIIWFFGFEVIGGEWFAMWQSSTWNGLGSAERVVSFLVLVLILLHMEDQ